MGSALEGMGTTPGPCARALEPGVLRGTADVDSRGVNCSPRN